MLGWDIQKNKNKKGFDLSNPFFYELISNFQNFLKDLKV